MADVGPTSALEKIRADVQSLAQTNSPTWSTLPKIRRVTGAAERLVAAVEAVLELARKWEHSPVVIDPAASLRAVITREITGKGDGNGQ